MRKRIEEDKKKRGIPASDDEDEKRSGGELDRRARRSGGKLESASEKKIEVEDDRGRKEENKKIATIPCFRFIPIHKIPCFRFNSKTRKTTQNSFLIHI